MTFSWSSSSNCGVLTSRAVRDFWQAKGPTEVLDRLQRGEVSLDSAAQALGVSIANLAAHVADFGVPEKGTNLRRIISQDKGIRENRKSSNNLLRLFYNAN